MSVKVLGDLMYLNILKSEMLYESALALHVTPDVADVIHDLRRRITVSALAVEQMTPHVTVLFLGRMKGELLLKLHRAFEVVVGSSVEARLMHISTFDLGGDYVNAHIQLQSAALLELHEKARQVCARHDWNPQTKYVGSRYVPHLTIYDRVVLSTPAELTQCRIASTRTTLVNPHLMVRQVLSA